MDTIQRHDLPGREREEVSARYPELVSRYYGELAASAGSPIALQVTPDLQELSLENEQMKEDPVGEDRFSPVPNLTHRYTDRVLFLVSDLCPVYCRFCTRKRKVGRGLKVTDETVNAGLQYIREHREVRDVLLSGGDPLMLEPGRLARILEKTRSIEHVEILRVGTRVPAAMPESITKDLARLLADHAPLYIHTHFNHPAEITPQSTKACSFLADAGIPLNNQTVLLKGINDNPDTLERLFRQLTAMRVRPYYLFQMDQVRGTRHFATPLAAGIQIMEDLHRRTSPMALPRFAVDLPNGEGKVFPVRASVFDLGGPGQAIIMPDGTDVPYRD